VKKAQKMRIVHVIDYFQPVLGYQETFLSQEQLRIGHEVVVVTSDHYRDFPSYESSVGRLLGPRRRSCGLAIEEDIPVLRLPFRWESRGRAWLVGLEQALKMLAPEAVHVHGLGGPSPLRVGLALRRSSVGLVFDDHMLDVVVRKDLAGRAFYSLMPLAVRSAIPMDAAFVAVSEEGRKYMVGRLGVDPNRVEVIPLGSDDRVFKPDPPTGLIVRQDLGIEPGARLLVYAGKLVPQKGPDVLVKAVGLLRKPDVHVLLIGAGSPEYVRGLEEQAEHDGWRARLHFTSPVPSKELGRYYNASDICVWPKQASTSVLDAAACSKPVIIADEPVGLERVAAGNGLTCREGDPVDLARALETFLDDSERALEAGSAGRRMIEEKFSWRALTKRFMDLYERNAACRSGTAA
jgi:glycosyltransferase involved in cell wall biosynthesis